MIKVVNREIAAAANLSLTATRDHLIILKAEGSAEHNGEKTNRSKWRKTSTKRTSPEQETLIR
jgi:hypothetical protein